MQGVRGKYRVGFRSLALKERDRRGGGKAGYSVV